MAVGVSAFLRSLLAFDARGLSSTKTVEVPAELRSLSERDTGGGTSYVGGDLTWYDNNGFGACGQSYTEDDNVLAISQLLYDQYGTSNSCTLCNKTVTITFPGGISLSGKITDRCEGCAFGSIDLSPALMQSLAGGGAAGASATAHGRYVGGASWSFNDGFIASTAPASGQNTIIPTDGKNTDGLAPTTIASSPASWVATSSAVVATQAPAVGASLATTTAAAVGGSMTALSATTTPTPIPSSPSIESGCTAWYLVQSGDTCSSIATGFNMPLSQFESLNGLTDTTCTGLLANNYYCVSQETGSNAGTTAVGNGNTAAGNGNTNLVLTTITATTSISVTGGSNQGASVAILMSTVTSYTTVCANPASSFMASASAAAGGLSYGKRAKNRHH